MNYLSVCSGIEAASVAWAPLGWRPLILSEIESFPREVLKVRHGAEDARMARNGNGPLLWGDFTSIKPRFLARLGVDLSDVDVLVGGTPCQSFSVSGLRKSLDDERGNLALQFVRLANAIDNLRRHRGKSPVTIVWENVPGILSVHDNAFGCFLGGMVGSDAALVPPGRSGWTDAGVVAGPKRCAAWRCLDARHFGLAQRRKRVFVLARGGADSWECADALLPIIDSMRWHSAPGREARQAVAGTIAARAKGGCGFEPGGASSRPSRVTETHIPGSETSMVSSQVLNGIEGGGGYRMH